VDFDYTVMPIAIAVIGLGIDALCLRYLFSLSRKTLPFGRKAIRFVLPCAAMLLTTSAAATSACNAIATHLFWAKHPPSGRFEIVNGHRMYINCTGSGPPTLVLDAGLGDDSVIWSQLQPVLSKTTRVCSYDRAGFGWSQAVSGPRDADRITAELHLLLSEAGITGPVVLMSHSIAGLYAIDYAELFPSQVAGLVLVDSSAPFQDRKMGIRLGASGPPPWLLRMAMIVGVPRLIGMCSYPARGPDAWFQTIRKEDICRIHYGAMSGELREFDTSSSEVERRHSLGSVPILIFSHDPLGAIPRKPQTKVREVQQQTWNELQDSLKALSTRSRRIIVVGGTHHLFEDRPGLVEKKVAGFVQQVRGAAPPPSDYGSTKRE
jgi:pimeloyl-ACP methyl ester carboxylesterase